MPGNVQKRSRQAESDLEEQIRLGRITPFAQLQIGFSQSQNYLDLTGDGDDPKPYRRAARQPIQPIQPIQPPKIPKQSSAFKLKTATPNLVVKKKNPQAESSKAPLVTKRRRMDSLTQQVPDFVKEKKDVILEGGYRLPRSLFLGAALHLRLLLEATHLPHLQPPATRHPRL